MSYEKNDQPQLSKSPASKHLLSDRWLNQVFQEFFFFSSANSYKLHDHAFEGGLLKLDIGYLKAREHKYQFSLRRVMDMGRPISSMMIKLRV